MRSWFEASFHDQYQIRPEVIVPIAAHASKRLLYRLSGGGYSAIGTITEDKNELRAFLHLTEIFLSLGLRVPQIFKNDSERGFTLIGDLGETTLLDVLKTAPEKGERLYQQAVSELPRLQLLAHPKIDYQVCYPRESFDRASIVWDIDYFNNEFLKRLGIESINHPQYLSECEFLINILLQAPADSFLYRDFQARNIVIQGELCGFIDYQGGRKGPLQYDLVSLLYQSSANLSDEFRGELIATYLQALEALNPSLAKTFLDYWQPFILIRLLQVLGTYGKLGLGEGRQYFIDSIPFALKNGANFFTKAQSDSRHLSNYLPFFKDIIIRVASSYK
jgi:aminoglycoside/choline kinase family phosphotransferase